MLATQGGLIALGQGQEQVPTMVLPAKAGIQGSLDSGSRFTLPGMTTRSFPELSNFGSPPAEPGVYLNEITRNDPYPAGVSGPWRSERDSIARLLPAFKVRSRMMSAARSGGSSTPRTGAYRSADGPVNGKRPTRSSREDDFRCTACGELGNCRRG